MSITRLPPPPPTTTTTSYIHLRPQINKRLNYYYDNHCKKKSRPYFKFQTGSTTTFSGYTNINNLRNDKNKNEIYYHQQQQRTNNYNVDNRQCAATTTNNYIPSHMNNDAFHYPPQKNRRTLVHAQQFQSRISATIHNNREHIKSFSALNEFNGLILSDSICKHVRTEKLSSKQLHVKLSYESGCTCHRMIQFLKQQRKNDNNDNNDIFQSHFIVYSLCTNDVANIGAISAIKQCRELICLTRALFPKLQRIGWIALLPRRKPSRLYNSEEIGNHCDQFNQLLTQLGREMNFDIIYTNIQMQHLHIDELHPSISSGRSLIENALSNWFNKKKIQSVTLPLSRPTITTVQATYKKHAMLFNNKQYNKNKKQWKQKHFNRDNNNNNNDNNQDDQTLKDVLLHVPGKTFIPHYPHFLKHREEFFRKIKIPEEIENNKDDIFHLSNMHFQAEYFKTEAEKWKVYMTAANGKNNNKNKKEENNNSLPVARPSAQNLVDSPAP